MGYNTTSYVTSLMSSLHNMQKSLAFTNIRLVFKNDLTTIDAHICMLAAASPVLEKLINEISCQLLVHTSNNKLQLTMPEKILAETMKFIVQFIYSGTMRELSMCSSDDDKEIIENVLRSAKYLKMDNAVEYLESVKQENMKPSEVVKIRSRSRRKSSKPSKKVDDNTDYEVKIKKDKKTLLLKRKNLPRQARDYGLDLISEITSAEVNEELLDISETASIGELESKKIEVELKNKKTEHSCGKCNKKFKSLLTLKQHKLWHSGAGEKCDECRLSFNTELLLEKHKNRKHGPKQKHSCDMCNKSFASVFVLKNHRRTHTGNELYQCDICNKRYPYKSSLKTHMLIHRGKHFMCSVCGKTFTQKVHARDHELQHTGEKNYQCDICCQFFSHKSGLSRHIQDLHKRSKEYVCDECGKAFVRKNKLQEHQRIHTGERPYVCELCGVAYKSNRSLRYHKKVQHSIDVPKFQRGIQHSLPLEIQKKIEANKQQKADQLAMKADKKKSNPIETAYTQTVDYNPNHQPQSGDGFYSNTPAIDIEKQPALHTMQLVQSSEMPQMSIPLSSLSITETALVQLEAVQSKIPFTLPPANVKPTYIMPLDPGKQMMVQYSFPQADMESVVNSQATTEPSHLTTDTNVNFHQ